MTRPRPQATNVLHLEAEGGGPVSLTFPLAARPGLVSIRKGDRVFFEGQVRHADQHVQLVRPHIRVQKEGAS